MKKFIKPTLYSLIAFIIFTFIITLFNYIGILPYKLFKIIRIIGIIIIFFIDGFLVGKESNKKGWLNGLEGSLILLIIFAIFNLLFNGNFSIKTLIGYVVLIVISILGSMLGINKKNI
ncbi:MAG: TIGR04086 family membrane protein [Bacilli bacterium]|nr:TIGR04086 family membrane protein [Bacilli bacterium]